MSNYDDIFEAPAPRSEFSDQPFDKDAWGEKKQAERQAVYDLADATAVEVAGEITLFYLFNFLSRSGAGNWLRAGG